MVFCKKNNDIGSNTRSKPKNKVNQFYRSKTRRLHGISIDILSGLFNLASKLVDQQMMMRMNYLKLKSLSIKDSFSYALRCLSVS